VEAAGFLEAKVRGRVAPVSMTLPPPAEGAPG
jgi:hypothetical protein